MEIITCHTINEEDFADNNLALPGSLARSFPEGRVLLPPRRG
jgi:hypothetical protein